MRFRSLYLFLLLLFSIASLSLQAENDLKRTDIAISDATLLLPVSSVKEKVSYLLRASNGCFKWVSNNPEIVSIVPFYEGEKKESSLDFSFMYREKDSCSVGVWVSPVYTSSLLLNGTSTWITAEEVGSGKVLRCEVFLGKVVRIDILTTTRHLYKDDIETLLVQGFDQEGNLFSSLEGLVFQWSILPATEGGVMRNVVRFSTFKDSSLDVPQVVLKMEQKGQHTSRILLQGIDIGRARVSARLIEEGYHEVEPSVVPISVFEPIQLDPAQTIHVIPGALVQYKLLTVKKKEKKAVSMPNPQYIWSSSRTDIATIDDTGLVAAQQLGQTKISAHFRSMSDNEASAMLRVVEPAYLSLKISSIIDNKIQSHTSDNWYLVVDRRYQIEVEVYDSQSHKIYWTSDMHFDVHLPRKYFYVEESQQNNRIQIVKTLEEGFSFAEASLKSWKFPLTYKQDPIVISPPVKIIPGKLFLPYVRSTKHQYQLQATGGSGEYNWYSEDEQIMSVNANGIVSAQAPSSTWIVAMDRRNPYNMDKINARAVAPASLAFLPSQLEAQIDSSLILPVAVYDENGQPFDNCSALSLEWQVADRNIFALVNEPTEQKNLPTGSCSVKALKALKEGLSKVTVRYEEITAEVTVFAYPALKLVQPSQYVLLTIASSAVVTYEGGPNPWLYDPSLYYEKFTPESSNEISVKKVDYQGLFRKGFLVTCKKQGTLNGTITVGNQKTSKNPYPASSQVQVTIACDNPHDILFFPIIQDSKTDFRCPETAFKSVSNIVDNGNNPPTKYQFKTNQRVPFNVTLLDSAGRKFYNSTSVWVQMKSHNQTLATFPLEDDRANSFTQDLIIQQHEGSLKLSAEVLGYSPKSISWANLWSAPYLDRNRLHKEVEVKISASVKLQPPEMTLYNHPDNLARVDALGGSGYYKYEYNDSSVAKSIQTDQSSHIQLSPMKAGTVVVTLHDLCLAGSEPATGIYQISDISALQVQGKDYVKVGDSIELELTAFGSLGVPFSASQYQYMNLSYLLESKIVSLEKVSDHATRYLVRGLKVGSERITFFSQRGSAVVSQSKIVHVYPPFQLTPKKLNLLPGASFQSRWTGGPPAGTQTEITFTTRNPQICKVDSSGLLEGKRTGTTELIAEMRIYDGLSKEDHVLVGTDSATIIVKELNGIRIQGYSNMLLVGNEETVWVVGDDGETPFVYGSLGSSFHWEVQNPEIVSLSTIYQIANVALEEERGFSIRLVAKQAGKTRVTVHLNLDKRSPLVAQFPITVFDPFKLVSPSSLLLPPMSSYAIETNRDPLSLSYDVFDDGSNSDTLLSINERGVITTKSSSGEVFMFIKSRSERQQVALRIQIKSPVLLQILPYSPTYYEIPIGAKMTFNILLRDEFGSLFHSYDNFNFLYDIDYSDIISIKRGPQASSAVVKGLKVGDVVVRFYLPETKSLECYIKISVRDAIIPLSPVVHVGGKISFALPRSGDPFLWQSDDENIISVNPKNGVAIARSVGSVNISRQTPDKPSISVQVVRINSIKVDKLFDETYISNVFPSHAPAVYKYSVQFLANGNTLRSVYQQGGSQDNKPTARSNILSIDHMIVANCRVNDDTWVRVETKVDEKNGETICILTPYSLAELGVRLADRRVVLPEKLILTVTASDASRTYEIQQQEHVPFRSGFILSKKKLQLHKGELIGQVEVMSQDTDKIVATISENNFVEVRRFAGSSSNQINLQVQVKDESKSFDGVSLVIRDFVTQQVEEVSISYDSSASYSWLSQSHLHRAEGAESGVSGIFYIGLLSALVLILLSCCCVPLISNSKKQPNQVYPATPFHSYPPTSPKPSATPSSTSSFSAYSPSTSGSATAPSPYFLRTPPPSSSVSAASTPTQSLSTYPFSTNKGSSTATPFTSSPKNSTTSPVFRSSASTSAAISPYSTAASPFQSTMAHSTSSPFKLKDPRKAN